VYTGNLFFQLRVPCTVVSESRGSCFSNIGLHHNMMMMMISFLRSSKYISSTHVWDMFILQVLSQLTWYYIAVAIRKHKTHNVDRGKKPSLTLPSEQWLGSQPRRWFSSCTAFFRNGADNCHDVQPLLELLLYGYVSQNTEQVLTGSLLRSSDMVLLQQSKVTSFAGTSDLHIRGQRSTIRMWL
jgi:hypothetical protein